MSFLRTTASSVRQIIAAVFRDLKRARTAFAEQTDQNGAPTHSRAQTSGAEFRSAPADDAFMPDGVTTYAIGDVHGRADLLVKLLDMIRADAKEAAAAKPPVLIFLGDYIDRGFQSKDVLDLLTSEDLSEFETRFLKGNHEAAILEFLNNSDFGPNWAEFGGMETLVSYGVQPPRARTDPSEWARARDELDEALPMAHRNFLSILELKVTLGDYEFVHAGVDPNKPLDSQTEEDLLWIRDAFLKDSVRLPRVIVHGHTPESAPHRDHRRVGLDTGAYMSGRLTAGRFEKNTVRFITTGA